MKIMQLLVSQIRTDGGTQQRARTDQEVVEEYAAYRKAGVRFPPIVVFKDRAGRYWLASGFHRLASMILAFGKRSSIECEVIAGELRDAILYSCGCNDTHGLRRKSEDKRRAVLTLLMDEEWGQWNNREVARRCSVSENLVRKIRKALSAPESQIEPRQVNRGGTTYTMRPRKRIEDMTPQEQAEAIAAGELAALRARVVDECRKTLAKLITRLEPHEDLAGVRGQLAEALEELRPE